MIEKDFKPDVKKLQRAAELLLQSAEGSSASKLPDALPEHGIGSEAALETLAPMVVGDAARLGDATAFAHMDPPTPWIAAATTMWNAALNQNLLHPDLAPVARDAEARVLRWLAPWFGMRGGHMVPGSTVANLTALWAARETAGVTRVVASDAAHISVPKAAHILGLEFVEAASDAHGCLDTRALPRQLDKSVVVLTAGTTANGAIDPLSITHDAGWTHIDAAWAGPLALTDAYRDRLDGLDRADSVAVSAHKWMFQPKESALIMFRDVDSAHRAISFGADYLATPNIGVLGSHGAVAVPLLATLLSWGRAGLAHHVERLMAASERLHGYLDAAVRVEVLGSNMSGVILWRSVPGNVAKLAAALPHGAVSTVQFKGASWLRNVAANPNIDIERLVDAIDDVLGESRGDSSQDRPIRS